MLDKPTENGENMILGITGGIGTGKSTVLNILKEKYNFIIFEADKIAHEVMNPNGIAYNEIVDYFGDEILYSDSSIDRKKMSSIVFNNKEKLEKLNSIVHPAVIKEILQRIEKNKALGYDDFVIEAALLIESGCSKVCDMVWYVYADESVRVERLIKNRNMTAKQIENVIKNQMSHEFFLNNTNAIIDNSKSFEDTCMQVQKLLEF